MGKKEEFHTTLNKLWRIHHQAQETFNYCFDLNKKDSDEVSRYIFRNRHLRFIKVSLWKVLTMELSKLFDKEGYPKIIHGLKNSGHYRSLNFDAKTLLIWEATLEGRECTIKKLKNLRDKVYAHTDKFHADIVTETDITFSETKDLILFSEEVIRRLFNDIFDSEVCFKNVYFDNTFLEMLTTLQKAEDEKMEGYAKRYRRNS